MQHKLTLSFIGFALIPLFIVLQWMVSYQQKDYTYSQAQDTTQFMKTQISIQVRERVRDLQSFALTEAFWENQKSDLSSILPSLENYVNALLTTHPEYRLVLLVDQKGRVQVANTKDSQGNALDTASLLGKSFDRASWFQKALTNPDTFIENPKELEFIKSLYGNEKISLLPVVKSIRQENGDVVGVWVIFTDASFLKDILIASSDSVQTAGFFGLYDNAGNPLAEMDTLQNNDLGPHEQSIDLVHVAGHDWTIKTFLKKIPLIEYIRMYLWPVAAALGLIILYAFVAARRFVIPLQRLVSAAEFTTKGKFSFGMPYAERADEYGRLSRALTEIQKTRSTTQNKATVSDPMEQAAQKIEDTVQLIHSLSAQTNMLALNASMEAVKSHHLDEVAEKANELAQKTSYNSQELLKKLKDIKEVCDDIQNHKSPRTAEESKQN